ncbi:hypothetical protein LUZ60_004511 [Juncus effusus]|nr:hypothetical protein LUZ60_004511 [Juncus effusus]
MADHSDSDASPKGSDSSGDDEKSGSSDGVLVEIPANPDQEEHNGILVNIDGSTQDARDDASVQDEMFEDATDEPQEAAPPGEILTARSGGGLEESMAVIEFGESSASKDAEELARVRGKLEDSLAECKKYKEEREVFGREVASLRSQLLEMINKDSLASLNEETLILPTPLHGMLNDCSKFALHLKTLNSDEPAENLELRQEIEALKLKNAESVVSRDVIFSYLGSMHDSWSETLKRRLLPSLNSVLIEEKEGSLESTDVLDLVENKIVRLLETQREILSQIGQFNQYLAGFRPEFQDLTSIDSTRVLNIAFEELVQTKERETEALENMNNLERKNKGILSQFEKLKASLEASNAENSKVKGELEQAESKYLAIKEKLSMAVTKGKSLVQTRDSLKHALAEKASEIEKCTNELKEKSDLLEQTEKLLEEKTNELKEKSEALQSSEITIEELQKFVEVKISELREKSGELKTSEVKQEELQKLLEEKTSELASRFEELKEKTEALEETEKLLEEKKSELQSSEINVKELEKLLEEKTSELVIETEIRLKEVEKSLEDKMIELETCFLELQASESKVKEVEKSLQEKTIEHEKCLHELQESEGKIKELEKLLEDRTNEHEKHLTELQEREGKIKELEKLLEEKKTELEKSLLESQEKSASQVTVEELQKVLEEKSEVLQATETTVKELQISLGEKTNELEKSTHDLTELKKVLEEKSIELEKHMNESKERSVELEVFKASSSEISETQNTIAALQLSLSEKENLLNQIKETLNLVDLPVEIFSSELDSQINWLVNSMKKASDNLVKMEGENSNLGVKLSDLGEEIEGLKSSLLEEKQEKDVMRNEFAEILAKYQKTSYDLSLVSSQKDELIKSLEESFQITMDRENENPNSAIEKFVSGIQERAKSSFDDQENFEKLQGLVYEKDQEVILCKKLLEDSVSKSEFERLTDELNKLKNEKELLQKEFERVEEKNALVREKLSMAVKKGKGLVQEREGFKQALEEKNSQIERLKNEVESKDLIVQNLKEQIETLSVNSTRVNELESEISDLKRMLDQTKNSLDELVDLLDKITVPSGTSFERPIEKLNWVKMKIEESEIFRVETEKELANAVLKNQVLDNELNKAKELISSISKEKEGFLRKKTSVEQELEKIKFEFSTSTGKIKTLENELSQAEKDISSLETLKSEIEMRHQNELSELNTRLNECTEELRETQTNLENHLLEKNKEFEKLKEIFTDKSLLYLVKDEFRKKINSLRSMGLLMHEMHQQFNSKGYTIDPSIEVSGFAKFLSLPSYDKFINERESRNKTENKNFLESNSVNSLFEGLNEKSEHFSNYFKDLSNYMDDHVNLMSQALQATSEEFFHMMDCEETLKFDLEKLEENNKEKEEELKTLSSDINDLRAKLEKAEFGSQSDFEDRQLYKERISTLEKDNLNLKEVCDELKSKIQSYELLQESSTKDRGISDLYFSEQEMIALIDKVNKLELSENPNFSNPLEKILYILDQFINLHQKISDLNYEKEDLQFSLASNQTEIETLKSEYQTIYTNLEKLVQKLVQLGRKENLQDQKLNNTGAILSFLERVVVNLITEYDNSKSKLMEMEGKLKTREKLVNELNERLKMLEDSHQFLVSQERGIIEASSSRNSDSNEIEDLGPIGKSVMTSAARSTRKVPSDHLVLNIGAETERLVSAQETEDKGQKMFKSLNTSGLIPVQGKFIADKVDNAWVSGSRVLMSQPRARLGLVAYCLFLHLWFLGSIVL